MRPFWANKHIIYIRFQQEVNEKEKEKEKMIKFITGPDVFPCQKRQVISLHFSILKKKTTVLVKYDI
jgi:hypothetical protein